MLNTMSKIRGQVKNPGYPQAEGLLGECMGKYGRDLGEETNFGNVCACARVCVHCGQEESVSELNNVCVGVCCPKNMDKLNLVDKVCVIVVGATSGNYVNAVCS